MQCQTTLIKIRMYWNMLMLHSHTFLSAQPGESVLNHRVGLAEAHTHMHRSVKHLQEKRMALETPVQWFGTAWMTWARFISKELVRMRPSVITASHCSKLVCVHFHLGILFATRLGSLVYVNFYQTEPSGFVFKTAKRGWRIIGLKWFLELLE